MDRDRKIISWRLLALMLAVLLVIFGVMMHMSQKELASLRAQDAALQMQLSSMEMTYSDLKAELRWVGSDSYVENEAREKYDFIKEGELCFEVTNPQALDGYTQEEWQIILDEKYY
ncbi:MAG: septum formation initiator family protein [Clostridia bacterium]|nr:septum formation initiator family protein [Clostridia bacterium]